MKKPQSCALSCSTWMLSLQISVELFLAPWGALVPNSMPSQPSSKNLDCASKSFRCLPLGPYIMIRKKGFFQINEPFDQTGGFLPAAPAAVYPGAAKHLPPSRPRKATFDRHGSVPILYRNSHLHWGAKGKQKKVIVLF